MDLNDWLSRQRLVVCVGSGGVGKTTTSAAIALWAASQGRKVIVLTIDPARRLANSLGLSEVGGEATRIDLGPLGASSGELWAMMLDSRSTFDGLIEAIAPTEEAKQRILDNHIYRHMSDTFAGSQDYMATEKLHDLVMCDQYDLVVLDTPPVKNALDFLESPGRVVNFLDEKVLGWFLAPVGGGGALSGLMWGTSAVVYRLLGQVFGRDFLDDLTDFFRDFQGLYEGFRERHHRVLEVFQRDGTSFVTVCAPTESSLDIAVFFQEELRRRELPRAGVVVNQVHLCSSEQHDAQGVLGELARELSPDLPGTVVPTVLARLGKAHQRLRALRAGELTMTARVREAARGSLFYTEVPRLEREVHDLSSLLEVGRNLFTRPAEPAR